MGLIAFFVAVAALLGFLTWAMMQPDVAVLQPKGSIANEQYKLLMFTLLLSAVVVIPVFILAGVVAFRYRESNPKKAKYNPNFKSSSRLEALWWGIPIAIITILAVITWTSSHSLDPYKKIESSAKPVEVQVVALQWKWLFIYPEQKIATVDLLKFPEKTPLNLTLTADAPMNAFWIPELGGQIYAMNGMSSQLSLMADGKGTYAGKSTNISGEGYARMNFSAQSVSHSDFDTWVQQVRQKNKSLTMADYEKLSQPSVSNKNEPQYYILQEPKLYDSILNKYMPHNSHEMDMTDEPSGQSEHDEHKMHDNTMNEHMHMNMGGEND